MQEVQSCDRDPSSRNDDRYALEPAASSGTTRAKLHLARYTGTGRDAPLSAAGPTT
jgi:hypothetical protein